MLALVAVSFALQAAAQPTPRIGPAHAAALRDSLEAAQLRFFVDWGQAWRRRAQPAAGLSYSETDQNTRNRYLHCHPGFVGIPSIIKDPQSTYAVCPAWDFEEIATRGDERLQRDAFLDLTFARFAFAERLRLIDALAAAATLLPTDDWIAGQRVRLLLDQGNVPGAVAAANECVSTVWWCGVLRGYALTRRGDIVAAEAAFDGALAAMPADTRCAWTDLTELIDFADRAMYARVACKDRDALNTRIWWLADPLYIEAGNERRVEHFARLTQRELHGALDRDERYDWRAGAGENPLRRLIERYGWPLRAWWAGSFNEARHSSYLASNITALNQTYTTFEYSFDRIHAFPAWRAIADPLRAQRADWQLSAPDAMYAMAWWPREHFAPRKPLLQLRDGQTVMLRRQDSVILATALDLDGPKFTRAAGDTIRTTLVATTAPDAIKEVAHSTANPAAALMLRTMLLPVPALLSVEFPAGTQHVGPGGRTRFSVAPPPPLSVMKPGEYAISTPVVLLPPADGGVLPSGVDAALQRMAGSTVINRGGKLGLYWETYGLAPGDSVTVAVWIERYTSQGIIRRFGIALSVATDLNTPIAISWTEPNPGRISSFIPGRVPILGRSLTIDASALPLGDYWLEVAVARRGSPPARGRISVTIQ